MLVRIANVIYNQNWLILPSTHQSIVSQFETYLEHGSKAPLMLEEAEEETKPQNPYDIKGDTMVIPISGVIGKRLSLLESLCGGYDLNVLNTSLMDALYNDAVKTVVLHIDSPGGTVTGVAESANLIKELSQKKTVIAYTDTLAASAAYWLAASANLFFASPSAQVGSVGVYRLVVDATDAYKKEGIKVEAISAGKYKLAGADFKPLSEEERKLMQQEVDKIYSTFVSWVSTNRPLINKEELPLARVYDGDDASRYGFVDGNIEHLEDVLAMVQKETSKFQKVSINE